MNCGCNQTPCGCSFPPGYSAEPPKCSFCNRPEGPKGNVWIERGDSLGDEKVPGVCMLDTLTEAQVIYILERDDKARADLLLITTEPRLLELARTIQRLPTERQDDALQTEINRPHSPSSLPFYSLFRGYIG